MCFPPTQTPLQFFSSGVAGKVRESGSRVAANSDSSSASVQVETGDMFRCYTRVRGNLNQHMLSQTFRNWGKKKKESCWKFTTLCFNQNFKWFLICTRLQAGEHSSWYLNEAPTTFCGNMIFYGSECKTQQQHHCKLWNISKNTKHQLRCQYSFKHNVAS